jgi:alcohol dehydrogenase
MSPQLGFHREIFPESPVVVYTGSSLLAGALPEIVEELEVRRVFVVCGQNVVRLEPVQSLLEQPYVAGVYATVEPDPSDATIRRAGAAAHQAEADLILGLGGGSSLDAAKAVAAEAVAPGWIDTCDQPARPTEVPEQVLPLLAVPTTAGTGSEVTPFSVITFQESHRKLVLNHEALLPRAALLDPTLLVSAPRQARRAAGLDCLTHALESYLSKRATPQTQARAEEAATTVMRCLPAAAAAAPDVRALGEMQRAAMLAGLAFTHTRLGIVHAAALPVSALYGIPHGVANAILLPPGLEFNQPAAAGNFARLESVLPTSELAEGEAGTLSLVAAVRALGQLVGAPQSLSEVGVRAQDIPAMAAEAALSAHLAVNPRETTETDLIHLYQAAY